jgi:drug/metabolite transporter (DMT)-like permease
MGLRERWSLVRFCAMALGVIGLAVLFAPEIMGSDTSSATMFGLVAVAWAAISSAWGSVFAPVS